MMVRNVIVALGAVGLLAGAAGAAEPSGQSLYRRYGCYTCHGYAGAGGMSAGPALAGRRLDPAHIVAYARRPLGVMPPYRASVLPDAALAAIAAYIARFPAPKPVAEIPALARLAIKAP